MIRISTLISLMLILLICGFWYGLFMVSATRIALWDHGRTAVLLPIDEYVQSPNKANGKIYYLAKPKARTAAGEEIAFSERGVSLEEIKASHEQQIKILYLPEKPTQYFVVGREPSIFFGLLCACGFSFAGLFWFRRA